MKPVKNIIAETTTFRIHLIRGYISNIYLVEYPASILMLDSGSISDVPEIQAYCEKICGRPVSDISLCVVSHMHPDHAGGAAVLRNKFGIPIASYNTIDEWYSGITGFIQHALDCRMEQYVSSSIGKKKKPVYFSRKLRPDHPLNGDGPLPVFCDWRVIHIPGHTLHDIALFNPGAKILHTGDAILTVNGRYRLPIPVFFKGAMRTSFTKLSGLDFDTVLPGHGDIINTDNPAGLFKHMSDLIDEPMSDMSRTAHSISVLTPAVWKATLRHYLNRIACS